MFTLNINIYDCKKQIMKDQLYYTYINPISGTYCITELHLASCTKNMCNPEP